MPQGQIFQQELTTGLEPPKGGRGGRSKPRSTCSKSLPVGIEKSIRSASYEVFTTHKGLDGQEFCPVLDSAWQFAVSIGIYVRNREPAALAKAA
jgi:hypothetical protein